MADDFIVPGATGAFPGRWRSTLRSGAVGRRHDVDARAEVRIPSFFCGTEHELSVPLLNVQLSEVDQQRTLPSSSKAHAWL